MADCGITAPRREQTRKKGASSKDEAVFAAEVLSERLPQDIRARKHKLPRRCFAAIPQVACHDYALVRGCLSSRSRAAFSSLQK
jgi:hypothetical protein